MSKPGMDAWPFLLRSAIPAVIVALLAACSNSAPPTSGAPLATAAPTLLARAVPTNGPTPPTASAAPQSTPTTASSTTTAGSFPRLTEIYKSAFYGYTIGYPTGWTTTDGAGPWPPNTTLGHGNPHLDVVTGAVGDKRARFIGASQPLPAGTTNVGFLEYQGQTPGDWAYPAIDPLSQPLTIDGLPAFPDLNGAHSLATLGGNIWDIVVVTPDGRGYNFTFDGSGLDATDVTAWLATIRLYPDKAVDAK